MKTNPAALPVLTSAGMELAWRFAWANFLCLALLNRPFPWADGLVPFALSGIMYALFHFRGWRIIQVLVLQILGFGLAALHLIHGFHAAGIGFFDPSWLRAAFSPSNTPTTWLTIFFEASLALVFWLGGIFQARRKKTYDTMANRFDLGLSVLFVLFLVKLTLRAKFGVTVPGRGALMFTITFLTFGLPALALARTRTRAVRTFQPGFHQVGVVLSFTGLAVLLGTGTVAFFLPQLTAGAELGFQALSAAAQPLGPVVVAVLRFLLAPGRHTTDAAPQGAAGPSPDLPTAAEPSAWMNLFTWVATWTMTVLICLAGLALVLLLLHLLLKWLFSRTPRRARPPGLKAGVRGWLEGLSLAWRFFAEWIKTAIRRRSDPVTVYMGLVQWGRRSGLDRLPWETPREYGRRLSRAFPFAGDDIMAIVHALETTVYAGRNIAPETFDAVLTGFKRLGSPALWPRRVMVGLREQGGFS